MTDFDFDCKEKKRIASGAYHKKNGSKSKGCKLPSDYLTASQKKKLNGEVKSMDLNRPMKWHDFKKLDNEHQKMYLKFLIDTYDVSQFDLSKMFDCAQNTVKVKLKILGISTVKNTHPTYEHKQIWKAFCNGVVGGPHQEEAKAILTELTGDSPDIPNNELTSHLIFGKHETPETVGTTETVDQIRFERDFYKARYFELIEKLTR